MSTKLAYAHIEMRNGVPCVEGTRIKVLHLALEEIAYGWDAIRIHDEHPDLSLGQIHSALAYYHDHRSEIAAAIEEQERVIREAQQRQDDTPALRARLRAAGLMP